MFDQLQTKFGMRLHIFTIMVVLLFLTIFCIVANNRQSVYQENDSLVNFAEFQKTYLGTLDVPIIMPNIDAYQSDDRRKAVALMLMLDLATRNRRYYLISDFVFNFCDVNHDGKVTAAEVAERIGNLQLLTSEVDGKKGKNSFQAEYLKISIQTFISTVVDQNKNGLIEASEMRNLFHEMRISVIQTLQTQAVTISGGSFAQELSNDNAKITDEMMQEFEDSENDLHYTSEKAKNSDLSFTFSLNGGAEAPKDQHNVSKKARALIKMFANVMVQRIASIMSTPQLKHRTSAIFYTIISKDKTLFAQFMTFLYSFIDLNADGLLQPAELVKFYLYPQVVSGQQITKKQHQETYKKIKNNYMYFYKARSDGAYNIKSDLIPKIEMVRTTLIQVIKQRYAKEQKEMLKQVQTVEKLEVRKPQKLASSPYTINKFGMKKNTEISNKYQNNVKQIKYRQNKRA